MRFAVVSRLAANLNCRHSFCFVIHEPFPSQAISLSWPGSTQSYLSLCQSYPLIRQQYCLSGHLGILHSPTQPRSVTHSSQLICSRTLDICLLQPAALHVPHNANLRYFIRMTFRPISRTRLHVLYTTPLLLGLICVVLIVFSLCGLVPWKQTSGTILNIHRESSDTSGNDTASFHFGLLGSCYRVATGHQLHCTPIAFPPDYNTTIQRGGRGINAEHLEIMMPDLPPVFFTWLLISIIALGCHALGLLPIYAPGKLSQHRFRSQTIFSATLWILGIGWALGFSAVLSLACFVQGFSEEYNLFSSDFLYNKASSGDIFIPLTIAMVTQVLIVLALIIQIANEPDKEKEEFSSSWVDHLRVTGP